MSNNTKFKSGQSGNPKARFKPGNPYRWLPGKSGNPAGISRSRLNFEEKFYEALLDRGSAEEVASLLWESVRKREPWAIQAVLQRLAPESKHLKVTHGSDHDADIDYSRLTDDELDEMQKLLERAAVPSRVNERHSPLDAEAAGSHRGLEAASHQTGKSAVLGVEQHEPTE